MRRKDGLEQQTLSFVAIFALAVGAVTGWGMWFLAGQRADRTEQELRTLVSTLTQRQVELLHERTQAQNAKADLVSLQTQAASLRKEVADLIQRRDKVQTDMAAGRPEVDDPAQSSRQHASEAEAESTTIAVNQRKANITLAQRELTKLGYGPLAADGILGPSTTNALEAFQYKNGLDVTKELDAATLRRLTGSTAIAASE